MIERSMRRVVSTVGFGQLLAWGSSYYLVAVLGPKMATGIGIANVTVYAMFSAALLVSAVLGPYAGRKVDVHGGRVMLLTSNLLFASALATMALAPNAAVLLLGWLLMGAAMPFGLYDAGFATVVRHFGQRGRAGIVTVTLIAGFASSLSWPLSHWWDSHYGWRAACGFWVLAHLLIGLPLHALGLPRDERAVAVSNSTMGPRPPARQPQRVMLLLMAAYAATGFVFAALAAHLPRLLEAAGCTPAAAVRAAAFVGACQVLARLLEAGYLQRFSPLVSAYVASLLHPIGALALWVFGAPAAVLFTALHGGGVGIMTIVKGTLPLALFGPAGFGRRGGILEAPSKLMQAVAPVVFSLCLDRLGAQVLWLTAGLSLGAFAALRWVGVHAALRDVHPELTATAEET
jgi:MFS family permease